MRRLVAVLTVAMLAPQHASSQEALEAAATLAAEGRSEEARRALMHWWDDEWSGASRLDRQRGLWMRARLTVDPSLAALDYQRLVVEYPGGPYSDGALFRMAQSAEARGDTPGAASHYAALMKDYPVSGHAVAARWWLGEHPESVAQLRAAEASRREQERQVIDPEPQAVEAPGTPLPDETPVEANDEPQAVIGGSGGYAVQLGAFSDGRRARRLADRAAAEGLDARLVRVPASDLVRVRVGRFEDQDEALELMRKAKAKGFEVVLVTDAAQEDPIS